MWDGNLDISASALPAWHGLIKRGIANRLETADQAAGTGTGVVLTERTVREPDVTRFRPGIRPDLDRSQFAATDVDLVVEVVTPTWARRDRIVKPGEYAAAGIPEFWLVEEHADDEADAVVNIYRLNSGSYALLRSIDLSALERELEQEIES